MAGLLNPSGTGPSSGSAENPPAKIVVPPPPLNTLSPNGPLAGATNIQPPAAPLMHNDEAVNAALMAAFRPVVPDQINSLLGPAIGSLQGRTPPIAYYQPRQPTQVKPS